MRYVMLIHQKPEAYEQWDQLSREEKQAEIERHEAWFRRYGEHIKGGEELASSDQARVIRSRGGRVMVTDGPFAEAKEILGSFIVFEATDMAAVEAMAAEWPALERFGPTLEILPTTRTTPD